ncbi:MAG: hypothetical protein KAW83_02570 [Dehalococcoidia bacterium]|nr:hypothetical protein [Dehalococcoidia bacterium]
MEKIPELKDWRGLLEKRLNKVTYTEEDILEVLYLCQDYMVEIQPAGQWVGQQQGFINQMQRIFNDMYFTRFNKQPPPRPSETPIPEVLLDTPEIRKQIIREVALSITKPGNEVSDAAVLAELKQLGKKLDLVNPTATISTILRGFRPQFEKVQGKRGVFRRQE